MVKEELTSISYNLFQKTKKEQGTLISSFYEANYPNTKTRQREFKKKNLHINIFMNIDTNILNKILANRIQQYNNIRNYTTWSNEVYSRDAMPVQYLKANQPIKSITLTGQKRKITRSYQLMQKIFRQNSTPVYDKNAQKNRNRRELLQLNKEYLQKNL